MSEIKPLVRSIGTSDYPIYFYRHPEYIREEIFFDLIRMFLVFGAEIELKYDSDKDVFEISAKIFRFIREKNIKLNKDQYKLISQRIIDLYNLQFPTLDDRTEDTEKMISAVLSIWEG